MFQKESYLESYKENIIKKVTKPDTTETDKPSKIPIKTPFKCLAKEFPTNILQDKQAKLDQLRSRILKPST